MVEQGTENPRVGSSILSLGTTYFQARICPGLFRFKLEFAEHSSVAGTERKCEERGGFRAVCADRSTSAGTRETQALRAAREACRRRTPDRSAGRGGRRGAGTRGNVGRFEGRRLKIAGLGAKGRGCGEKVRDGGRGRRAGDCRAGSEVEAWGDSSAVRGRLVRLRRRRKRQEQRRAGVRGFPAAAGGVGEHTA